MEVRLLEKDTKSIRVEIIGENETLLNLLKERLMAEDDVEQATYIVGHPLLDQPHLSVRMRKGKPEAAVRSAAKSLREDLDRFETDFLKAAREAGVQ